MNLTDPEYLAPQAKALDDALATMGFRRIREPVQGDERLAALAHAGFVVEYLDADSDSDTHAVYTTIAGLNGLMTFGVVAIETVTELLRRVSLA